MTQAELVRNKYAASFEQETKRLNMQHTIKVVLDTIVTLDQLSCYSCHKALDYVHRSSSVEFRIGLICHRCGEQPEGRRMIAQGKGWVA